MLSLEEFLNMSATGLHTGLTRTPEGWRKLEEEYYRILDTFNEEISKLEETIRELKDDSPESLPMAGQGFITVTHDDCEGKVDDTLTVCLAQDNDVHVIVNGVKSLRFRNMIGGGNNPNTHFALRNLYDAMVEDERLRGVGDYHHQWTVAANRYLESKK
ncbi:coil containing protein [Vibrio phage 1.121.O._10N.286.46.C4]|nr:coil containing protein [Vibrio phage 1.121.O._10N.286.46.C4]